MHTAVVFVNIFARKYKMQKHPKKTEQVTNLSWILRILGHRLKEAAQAPELSTSLNDAKESSVSSAEIRKVIAKAVSK